MKFDPQLARLRLPAFFAELGRPKQQKLDLALAIAHGLRRGAARRAGELAAEQFADALTGESASSSSAEWNSMPQSDKPTARTINS